MIYNEKKNYNIFIQPRLENLPETTDIYLLYRISLNPSFIDFDCKNMRFLVQVTPVVATRLLYRFFFLLNPKNPTKSADTFDFVIFVRL